MTTPSRGAGTEMRTGASGSARDRDRRPARAPSARRRRSAEPSATAASARRRPSSRSTPRSERASSRAQASSTSSEKSSGPSPRTMSIASRISSALPTARPSGWSMSVSRQTTSLAGAMPELEHLLREHPRVVERLHERAVADLHVEDDRVGARRELLRHDRRRDQRHDVDGRRDVAQRVELLVGGHEVRGLPDDRDADVAQLRDELVGGQLDAEARESTRACRACRRCARARVRSSSRTARRTRPRSGRRRATSCRRRRRSSACRRPCGRSPRRGRASRRERIMASVKANVSAPLSPWK